ncbi:LytTR family DNA-binding domain-containing protein [Vagococcus vulneris]|uniref:HTH LytTR-type domain-containing protein n=1 Tax=Vagococcus vulneris TaxID=1977869 RepID=A0A429ZYU6_9ENTE|nr:LytTR family DNA-binding domain-containing protein [Vagococcus vulneris]RST99128.1 hypothetical protein CBF37_05530 [Vagococcus vulneris]
MKININHIWQDSKKPNTIDIVSHPVNKTILEKLDTLLNGINQIKATDMINNRNILLNLTEIEAITALSHMSQIITTEGKRYFLSKRLKELNYLEQESFYRINQSTIINLNQIKTFNVEKYSRLNISMLSDNKYLISRHYAKNIKERLS